MMGKYLLHFAHEHVTFRWAEFLALTSRHNCRFRLISHIKYLRTRPFIIIELIDGTKEESLIKSSRESYLLKGLFELWARSSISVDHLAQEVYDSTPYVTSGCDSHDQPFRVDCESFGSKLSQTTKLEWIKKLTFLESFQSRPNLSEPKQSYCIFEMNDKTPQGDVTYREYYFGRLLTRGNRNVINDFSLKKRKFIANTTMDPMLSLIAANTAQVKENDFVYDPFVGSGGLLVAAAYKGAYVLGADIDWQLLHGKSRPSRKGQKTRSLGESVRANLYQYQIGHRYIDVVVSDITRSPLVDSFVVDSIISDPPYGIRECSEKIGMKKRQALREHKVRYPSKITYSIKELLTDLLSLSAKHLSIGGRLVYYLPVIRTDDALERFIPRHPCLGLITHCEQQLAAKVSRLMVVMEKTRPLEDGDSVFVPQEVANMNFRDVYFSKSDTAISGQHG